MIFVCPKSNDLQPTDSTSLASQLTTSNYLPFHCTVHGYDVIHFCYSICDLFEWKPICSYWLSFVCICISVGDPVFSIMTSF